MKWNASSFLENRVFDRRLVKDSLVDKWNIYGDAHQRQSEHRQFLESYPWTTSSMVPPIGQSHHDPSVPVRQSDYFQDPQMHPLTYTPLTSSGAGNAIMDARFASSKMPMQPVLFPNLVNSFDRNPTHAARAALYTRYTPAEWSKSCISAYADSDINRNHAERLRNDAVRLMRQTDEKTCQGQRDAGRRIGERLTDLSFWRNELNTELEKLMTEFSMLSDTRRKAHKALEDLDPPLHIAQECLYHRESRQGIEKVHDQVEKNLLTEVDRLKHSKEQLRICLEQIDRQLADLRAVQHELQEDIVYKESTLGIDTVCHKMGNNTRGINYYGGIERYDPTVSSIDTWAQASSHRINKSQGERGQSAQLRSNTDTLINTVATTVWDNWSQSNNALNRRSGEMAEAKNNMQMHLHRTQQEIFDIERNIELLRKAIQDKANPLKVAQSRLEARGHRAGLEQCKDFAHVRLVQEVYEIQASVEALQRKLLDAEAQHQQLLHTKSSLESNLKKKVNALFIDREKCMGIRRSFPVDSLIKY